MITPMPHIHSFIYMLMLPEGQMGEVWEISKKPCSFGDWGVLDIKVLSLFCASEG
jgi:hypothetical protein